MGRISLHLGTQRPLSPVSLLEHLFLVHDRHIATALAVLEPKRSQTFKLFLTGDDPLYLLRVKNRAKDYAEVPGKPPEIAEDAAMEYFDDARVRKNVLADDFAKERSI